MAPTSALESYPAIEGLRCSHNNVVPLAEDSRMLLETWNFMKLFEQSSTSVVLKDANATIIAPQASYLVLRIRGVECYFGQGLFCLALTLINPVQNNI